MEHPAQESTPPESTLPEPTPSGSTHPGPTASADTRSESRDPRGPLIERSVRSILMVMWGTTVIFLRLTLRPGFIQELSSARSAERPDGVPPLTFVIAALLTSALAVRVSILHLNSHADFNQVLDAGSSITSLEIQDVVLLTIPAIALVAALGASVGSYVRPKERGLDNPVARAVCYAAGWQVLMVAVLCAADMAAKFVKGSRHGLDPFAEVLIPLFLLSLFLWPTYHITCAARAFATAWPGRYRVARLPLAGVTALSSMIGVGIMGAISFDLRSTVAQLDSRESRKFVISDDHVFLNPTLVDSRTEVGADGRRHVHQTVAFANESERMLLLPRPERFRPYRQPSDEPFLVLSCSADWDGEAGWSIPPGEIQLIHWTVVLPDWASAKTGATTVLMPCRTLVSNGNGWTAPDLWGETGDDPRTAFFPFRWVSDAPKRPFLADMASGPASPAVQ